MSASDHHNLYNKNAAQKVFILDVLCRSTPKYAVRVSQGRELSPAQLVTNLQEAGVEAALSDVLPADFLVVNGLQHLIRQGFLERGDCQATFLHSD